MIRSTRSVSSSRPSGRRIGLVLLVGVLFHVGWTLWNAVKPGECTQTTLDRLPSPDGTHAAVITYKTPAKDIVARIDDAWRRRDEVAAHLRSVAAETEQLAQRNFEFWTKSLRTTHHKLQANGSATRANVTRTMFRAFPIGRLCGIRLDVHASWFPIYALVAVTIANAAPIGALGAVGAYGVGAARHSCSSPASSFTNSAHALTARRFGVQTTLDRAVSVRRRRDAGSRAARPRWPTPWWPSPVRP